MSSKQSFKYLQRLSRRKFLQGVGVSLALPLLEVKSVQAKKADRSQSQPQRMLIISNNLGILSRHFFPKSSGKDYELSPYLMGLEKFRNDFTVFSGLSHPAVEGGHSTENCFLTAAKNPTSSGFRNQISLDQFAADRLGRKTRFATLNLGVNLDKANRSLSWTRDGVLLPAEDSATNLFKKMFVQGTKSEINERLNQLRLRGSILDAVTESSNQFSRSLGKGDRRRLDQYFTSVRELELRLHSSKQWEQKPKPKSSLQPPKDIVDRAMFFDKFEQMLTMAQIALQTDSTRIVTMMVDAFATPAFQLDEKQKSTGGYHTLSHHGMQPKNLAQLEKADYNQIKLIQKLLENLSETEGESGKLLDSTMVLFGSNMGNANTHDNRNLPILLAGGGFKHGQHLAFDHENNKPLSNLFVSMLQKMGVEEDAFGSSTGTISGLV